MGVAIKHRKKFISHKKRWDKPTILDEETLKKDYALKNKKEIRKIEFLISKYKNIAKDLNKTEESKVSEEAQKFIAKLKENGFLSPEASTLDEVLDLKIRNILERRLSNIVYKKKLARTPNQARQFTVHRHVMVDGKCITSPSYLVNLTEEATITFIGKSSLADENHPERKVVEIGIKEELQEIENTPLKKNEGPSFDEKEAKLDDEEQDEVKE